MRGVAVSLSLVLAIILCAIFAFANYTSFTPSAYWTNYATYSGQSSTYMVSQTSAPDATSDYQLTSSTLPTCLQTTSWWEMDHHLLRATSDYSYTTGSAYDIVYDSKRCGMNSNPHLYVYKVLSGSAALL